VHRIGCRSGSPPAKRFRRATSHGHETALFGPWPDYAACVAFLKSHGLGRPAPLVSHQTAGGRWVAGMDGCAADWMGSFARLNEGEASADVRLRVLPRFAAILCAGEPPAVIAVDTPIGLPAQAGRGGRAAENMVRPLLGERQFRLLRAFARRALAYRLCRGLRSRACDLAAAAKNLEAAVHDPAQDPGSGCLSARRAGNGASRVRTIQSAFISITIFDQQMPQRVAAVGSARSSTLDYLRLVITTCVAFGVGTCSAH